MTEVNSPYSSWEEILFGTPQRLFLGLNGLIFSYATYSL